MRMRWQLVVFLFVVISITALLHLYFYQRLAVDTHLGSFTRFVVGGALFLLFSSLIVINALFRIMPMATLRRWSFPVYVWMGTMFFLFWSLLTADVVFWMMGRFFSTKEMLRSVFSLSALILAMILTCYSVWVVSRGPRVKQVDFYLKKWPKVLNGFKIIQLTDVHIGPTLGKPFVESLVSMVNQEKPDLIVLTGDLVDGTVSQLLDDIKPLQNLTARFGIYFVPGNHEYFSGADGWSNVLEQLGFCNLTNQRVSIEPLPTQRFDLAGVDDHHSGSYKGHGPDFDSALSGRDESLPVILLAHQPIAVKQASTRGVDLVLSGHTHGGQIWPWHYFVRLQQPYVSGVHQVGETIVYVSQGTGYWGPPMRLGTFSEITRVVIRTTAD